MRVLWLCNIMLPVIAKELGLAASNKEGWLTGLAEQLIRHREENRIALGVCFPVEKGCAPLQGTVGGLSYFGFPENTGKPERYDKDLEAQLKKVLDAYRPDVVHIFGTEFPHALAMTRCAQDKERVLIGIQGICSKIADFYTADLPKAVVNRFLIRDILRWDNIALQQKKFVQRGRLETEALRNAGHITGRTAWDRAAAEELAPDAKYHFMNETLRPVFYGPKWQLSMCERYSVFLSQGNYPVKGLHYLLMALPDILKRFPAAKVYVAGDEITRYGTLKEKIKIGSYGRYCLKLIKDAGLSEHVVFLGRLNSGEMCERYLKSHIYLSPSSIENSSNSVGEAMLLGMPVVSSAVGGVPSMLEHEREGLLYPCSDTHALTDSVCRLFADDALAAACGRRAAARAAVTHDPERNYTRLVEIYQAILHNAMKGESNESNLCIQLHQSPPDTLLRGDVRKASGELPVYPDRTHGGRTGSHGLGRRAGKAAVSSFVL